MKGGPGGMATMVAFNNVTNKCASPVDLLKCPVFFLLQFQIYWRGPHEMIFGQETCGFLRF